MKKTLSLLLAVALVLSLFASVGSVASAASAGQQLKDLGVIKGDTSGSLNETSTWDKQDLAVLISRLVGEEEIAAATPAEYGFNDIEDDYYDGYITWALQKGYITGISEREFGFNEPVSYKVLNAVILRVLGYDTTGANYDTTEDLAVSLGLSEATDFDAAAVRGIAYGSILAALNTAVKGGTVTLGQKLGVVYGAAAKLEISVPTGLVSNGASKGNVTVKVFDKDGYLVKNSKASITLSVASASATFTGGTTATGVNTLTVNAVNGVATAELTAAQAAAGSVIVAATSTGLTGVNGTLTTVAPKLSKVVLSADPAVIAADGGVSSTTITASLLDQTGATIVTASPISAFTSSNTGVIGTPATNSGVALSGNQTGSSVISATLTQTAIDAGVTVTPVTVSAAIVGQPYKLAIDATTVAKTASATTSETQQKVTVRVLDVNGNQVTGNSLASITLKKDGVAVGVAQTVSAGKVTFTVTNTTAGTVAYEATGVNGSTTLVAANGTGSFTNGIAAYVKLAASKAVVSANGTSTTVLTASVVDAAGNLVPDATNLVKFTKTAGTPAATAAFTATTVAAVAGKASVTVTASTTAGVDTYTAVTVDAAGTTVLQGNANGNQATVTSQIEGAANNLSGLTINGAASATVAAGTAFEVKVSVKDAQAQSKVVTTDNGRDVTLTVKESTSGTVVGTSAAKTVDGVATFSVNLTKKVAGGYTVTADSTGLTSVSSNAGAVTINAVDLAGYAVATGLSTLAADNASTTTVTVSGVDKYGNAVALTALPTLTANGTAVTPVLANGVATYTFAATTTPATTTFVASGTGLTSGTGSVTTVLTGVAAKLVIAPVTAVTAGTNQIVKVSITDANGNVVTGTANTVTIQLKKNGVAITPAIATTDGSAEFTVATSAAGTVEYTAVAGTGTTTFVAGSLTTSAAVVGTVNVGVAHNASVATDVPTITNNGTSVANLTFKILDGQGNVVTSANGTATFEIVTGGDYSKLVNASASFVNGQATVTVQSKYYAGTLGVVTVKATTTILDDASTPAAITLTSGGLDIDSVITVQN